MNRAASVDAFEARRSLIAIVVASLIVAVFVVVFIFTDDGSVTADAEATKPALDETLIGCSAITSAMLPAADSPKNTVIDAEHGLLQITYRSLSGQLQTVTVDYLNDEACSQRPGIRETIEHARDVELQTQQARCDGLRNAYTHGVREIKGRPIDRGALERYLENNC